MRQPFLDLNHFQIHNESHLFEDAQERFHGFQYITKIFCTANQCASSIDTMPIFTCRSCVEANIKGSYPYVHESRASMRSLSFASNLSIIFDKRLVSGVGRTGVNVNFNNNGASEELQ